MTKRKQVKYYRVDQMAGSAIKKNKAARDNRE